MENKKQQIIYKGLISISVCFLVFSAYLIIRSNIKKNVLIEYTRDDQKLYLSGIINQSDFSKYDSLNTMDKKKYTIMYLITSSHCSICIKQYEIYNQYFTSASMSEQYYPVIAVIDSISQRARWYAKINPLKIDAIAITDSSTKDILTKYGSNNTHENRQILVIDNLENKVIGRIKISTGISQSLNEINKQYPAIMRVFTNQ